MSDELLCLYGSRYAVLGMIDKGSTFYAKQLPDGTIKKVYWYEICDCLEEMIERIEKDEQ